MIAGDLDIERALRDLAYRRRARAFLHSRTDPGPSERAAPDKKAPDEAPSAPSEPAKPLAAPEPVV